MRDQNDRVEFIVKLFQTGMKKVEEITPKLESTLKDFESQKDKYIEFVNGFQNINNNREKFEQFISDTVDKLQKDISDHTNLIDYTKNLFEEEKKEIAQFWDVINVKREKISTLFNNQEKFAKLSDVDLTKNSIEDLRKLVEENQKICQDTFLKLTKEQAEFRETLQLVKNSLELFRIAIGEKNAEIISVKNDLQSLEKSFADKIVNLFSNCQSMVNEAVNAIPKPEIPRLEDAQKAFNIQLEPVMLDAKNAALRAVNNETKINILERKIDQLQLMINKLQLQG